MGKFEGYGNIPLKGVKIDDSFWAKRIKLISEKVIPYQWDALNDNIPGAEPSHAVENFRIAAGESDKAFHGMVFQDSDVAKWIEAASYSLINNPNGDLEKVLDEVIDLIGRAQQKDGYLNTYFTVAKPEKRWMDFSFGHELYCAGHMIEAAVAHFTATGKRKLLDIVCRYADYIDSVIGPEECKMKVYCGHEEIELALVKLYHYTGEKRYLNLSKYFIDERGKQPCFLENEPTFGHDLNRSRWSLTDYHQAHKPVREQTEADGHAVRAMYLYTAMADLALETGDETLTNALKSLFNNVVGKRMYITGGLGSQGHAERFTFDYDLPNDSAYTETCAAIGLIFWMNRMLQLDTDSKYADVLEKALYNGALSGISLDGTKYFYVNPLEVLPEAVEKRFDLDHVKAERVPWFGCACCPPNIARLITSLGQYIYTLKEDAIYTHLYIGGEAHFEMGGEKVTVSQKTNYPWDGDIETKISTASKREILLGLRIPGWCKEFRLMLNGEEIIPELKDGYVMIKRAWNEKDIVKLELGIPVELMEANPMVREDAGRVAIQRGPLVYCIEEVDNGSNLSDITIPIGTKLSAEFDGDLLEGIVVIKGIGYRTNKTAWTDGSLYKPAVADKKQVNITAIPYSMWGNRKAGEMLVWIRS